VKEAISRLPQHLVDERNFRIRRAMDLCSAKKILPEEQWTKWEEDVKYLDPYIEEVRREREEKDDWNSSH